MSHAAALQSRIVAALVACPSWLDQFDDAPAALAAIAVLESPTPQTGTHAILDAPTLSGQRSPGGSYVGRAEIGLALWLPPVDLLDAQDWLHDLQAELLAALGHPQELLSIELSGPTRELDEGSDRHRWIAATLIQSWAWIL